VLSGIGGQGMQLAARTLAEAAIADGRRVQLFASYGGMMRGGNSDAYLVIGDAAIEAPPQPGRCWAAVVSHHAHAESVWPSIEPDGIAVVNSDVVLAEHRPDTVSFSVVEIPALAVASDLGAPVAASLVAVGSLVAHTALVARESLLGTPERVLPSYRADAAELNRAALTAGLEAGNLTAPAWASSGAVRA